MDLARLDAELQKWGLGLHPRHWRLPPVDTYPAVIAFAQTAAGKCLLFVAFAVPMRFVSDRLWFWMTVAAIVVSQSGKYRHVCALAATFVVLLVHPDWFEMDAVYTAAGQERLFTLMSSNQMLWFNLAAYFAVAALCIWSARRWRDHPLGGRPVLLQHGVFLALLLVVSSGAFDGVARVYAWCFTAVFLAYFWYLAYALVDQRTKTPAPFVLQLASFHPFFGSTATPMAKGAANWRAVESHGEQELAVTQLKALKLIVWAFILKAVLWVYRKVVYGLLDVTPLWMSFDQFVSVGIEPGHAGAWSIVANYFEQLLILAIWGHGIVATARLAGFRLLRNTWRPLASRSIAEFWNRYFYYFKEILVNIYFYPTYLRCFKRYPRLRLAFATFMAAGFGNWLFHFMLQNHRIPRDGLLETIMYMQTYAFYCTLLVTGIVISQLRTGKARPAGGWVRRQFLPSLWVAAFYCFLSFFDGPQKHVTLREHFSYIASVMGLG